ncbi:MAG: peptidylprolyl isomerase, partial [Phaeodactylibacter sp.]|nr:peptidylprolyl isomerase [Phaeodactylibacter sp.]
ALLEGQAWGIYRFALRGITAASGTARMLELATDQTIPNQVRFIAANYLYRARNIDLSGADSQLVQALAREDDPRIRMALAIALGKTKTSTAQDALISQYNIEPDYRVKCNIIRAMGNFDYEQVKPTILRALEDENLHLSKCAATYFLDNGQPQEAKFYWEKAKDTLNWETQLELYAAANRHMPGYFTLSVGQINNELKLRFENGSNIYEQAAAVKALGEYGWNYRYIITKTFPSTEQVIRTACIEALQQIVYMEDFRKFFGASYRRVRQEISNHMIEVMKTADVGMIAVASDILRHPTLYFEGTLDSLTVLEEALQKLPLPRAIETYNELQRTLDFFEEKDFRPRKPNFNHPINWELAAQIKPGTKALVKTDKGEITLLLLPELAPGSVANFVQLIQDKFYDNKVFHRVVPNFVIQGGCP